jgi:hypothetical protein
MQNILIEMYNSRGRCDFSTQGVYRNESHFYTEMNRLVRYTPWVKKKPEIGQSGHTKMIYRLTAFDGTFIAEQLIKIRKVSGHDKGACAVGRE